MCCCVRGIVLLKLWVICWWFLKIWLRWLWGERYVVDFFEIVNYVFDSYFLGVVIYVVCVSKIFLSLVVYINLFSVIWKCCLLIDFCLFMLCDYVSVKFIWDWD